LNWEPRRRGGGGFLPRRLSSAPRDVAAGRRRRSRVFGHRLGRRPRPPDTCDRSGRGFVGWIAAVEGLEISVPRRTA